MHGRTHTNAYSTVLPLFGLVLLVSLSACGGISPGVSQSPTATPSLVATLPPSRYQITERQNVAYGPLASEKLDLCEPLGATSSRPGVILIHGGGWTSGDKSSVHFQSRCTSLAALGFVVANVNYRLADTNPYAYPQRKDMWPAQLVDVQLAVRWMRAQAQHLGLDPTRLCAAGSSAGAQLAVFLGVLATIHPGDEAQLLANQSPRVSCVVDNSGPVDLTKVDYSSTGAYFGLFGAAYQSNPAILREASPLFDVSSQSAPMVITQGTRDTIVPPDQALELQRALQDHHVPVQFISYDGGHVFQSLTQQQIETIEAQTAIFLVSHLHP
jgi:acetyl esterase/lipase